MSDFKEFQGKDLDEAIESACNYFNLQRERLEIEILSGGSSGIFGLMGVKKAKVQARPRAQVNASDILNGETKQSKPARQAKPRREKEPAPAPVDTNEPEETLDEEPNGNRIEEEVFNDVNGNVAEPEPSDEAPARKPRERKPRQPRNEKKGRERKPREKKQREPREPREPREQREHREPREAREPREEPRRTDMSAFDPVALENAVREVMNEMLTPIVGETSVEITLESDRVKVFIDDEENSGLIIGREGQTLSSIQYLVNRLVSRKMGDSVRIQVDTGDYRERQDDKLRQIAWHLAEKADSLGRTQSTKPLSSYHRRVIHLALQDNETVFTRSKGDGPMKRVLIVPKSRKNNGRARY
ncbi:Jag N-terminal domain-containing protein [Pseudodesulfovibrio thermohalotolerans]|uniref:Jag family protein n=1 Tax=Pseudodesulfovibrio thermohalotolerans TaxID=2880651 RepID=UPI0022B9EDCA|nr:Jag N-terminal domain-containing protein [Pseudodesulfovibrio thermohalotolerans]WFS63520.1 Jag N-terminal domain-containing protein [Pseudodesulfovibrio thermohalotolerans]